MKTKHTPGPWDNINLCDLLDKSPEEIEANITLMNAAPEMLQVLMQVESHLLDITGIDNTRNLQSPLQLLKFTQSVILKATS